MSKLLSKKTKIPETFSDFLKNDLNHLAINRNEANFKDEPVHQIIQLM